MQKNEYCTKRILSEKNIVQFRKKLELVNWTNILSQSKCQNAFTMFHQEYCKLYEECFPLVKVKLGYKNRKPWLTSALKMSIKHKNKLYVKSIKVPTLYNISQYKKYRNILHSLLRKSEKYSKHSTCL